MKEVLLRSSTLSRALGATSRPSRTATVSASRMRAEAFTHNTASADSVTIFATETNPAVFSHLLTDFDMLPPNCVSKQLQAHLRGFWQAITSITAVLDCQLSDYCTEPLSS